MAQASPIQEGLDQVRTAVRRADKELKKIQRQVKTRRSRLEKDLTSRRKKLEKRAQTEIKRVQREIRKQPLVKRAESLRIEATKRFEKQVDQLLGALPIATKSDVSRIDRKITTLNRRIREMEQAEA